MSPGPYRLAPDGEPEARQRASLSSTQGDVVVLQRPAVKRVTRGELRDMCVQLAGRIRPFDPDLVVGIATGGADVAEAIAHALGERRVVIVTSQRPGTLLKQSRPVSQLLASLPERLPNFARCGD